jgi:hypothetical protein
MTFLAAPSLPAAGVLSARGFSIATEGGR